MTRSNPDEVTMAGAVPKPARLKLLNGRGPGKDSAGRPVNEGPKFVRDAPDPPTWLNPRRKAEWRRVVPELARLKLRGHFAPFKR